MKKSLSRIMVISLLSLLFVTNTAEKVRAQDVEVSFQTFYDNLAPYGQWVDDPQYGQIWVPNEEGNFRPYGSRGHWVMTDLGNTWVSDDPWGWACYHYGRWTYDGYYGWVWIPGYDWAPAWVSWRYGEGYCGWAPLGPGEGLGYNCPDTWWIFLDANYLYSPDCFHHWRGPSFNIDYIRRTSMVSNYNYDVRTHVQYNWGPRREDMEREFHHPVQVYRFNESHRAGGASITGQSVNMYRPEISRNPVNEVRPNRSYQSSHPLNQPQQHENINYNRPSGFRQETQGRPVQQNNYRQPQRQEQPRQQPQVQPQRQEQPRQQPQFQPQRQEQPRQQPQIQPQRQEQPRQQPQVQPQRQPQPPVRQPMPPANQEPQRQGGGRR